MKKEKKIYKNIKVIQIYLDARMEIIEKFINEKTRGGEFKP